MLLLFLTLEEGEWSTLKLNLNLTPGKTHLAPTGLKTGCTSKLVWALWREKNLLPLPGIEPTHSALSYVDSVIHSAWIYAYQYMPLKKYGQIFSWSF
jgi:hypothetical protein